MGEPVSQGKRKGEFLAGKYLLEDLLGVGGMGEVYRATNVSLGRPVAIKLLSAEFVGIESDVLRFLREARAAAGIRHANVIDILDVAREEDGTPFIVQELLTGEDLEHYLSARGGKLSCAEALEIMIPVADAVAAAHSHDVVHRDLKPANIFLARDRNKIVPKVLDFGACLFPTIAERSAKEVRMLIGTPHYMAPEQIISKSEVDARSDVWALGVILYEMLVGETPFEADTADAVMELVKTKGVPRLKTKAKDIPDDLDTLVSACTNRDRMARLANAQAVHAGMERIRTRMRGGDKVGRSVTLDEMPAQRPGAPKVAPKATVKADEAELKGLATGIVHESTTRPIVAKPPEPKKQRAGLLTLNSPDSEPPAPLDALDSPFDAAPSAPAAGVIEARSKPAGPTASQAIGRVGVGTGSGGKRVGVGTGGGANRTGVGTLTGAAKEIIAARDPRFEVDDEPLPSPRVGTLTGAKNEPKVDLAKEPMPAPRPATFTGAKNEPKLDFPKEPAPMAPRASAKNEFDFPPPRAGTLTGAKNEPKLDAPPPTSELAPLSPPIAARVESNSSLPPVLDPRVATSKIAPIKIPPAALVPSELDLDLPFAEVGAAPAPTPSTEPEPAKTASAPPASAAPSTPPPASPAPGPRPAAVLAAKTAEPTKRDGEWTSQDTASFAGMVAAPAILGFVAMMMIPALETPLGRALRGDSTLASGVLTVVALVSAAALCARSFLGEKHRLLYVASGGSILFGIAMIIVTSSASEAAETGNPASMGGVSSLVAPIAPLALALWALGKARRDWLDPYSKSDSRKAALLASAMLLLTLALSPMGVVRGPSSRVPHVEHKE